ncbi:hypothetical protein [Streptomyces sp. NBC_00388]|uniref:hypothetical protein n=1 Tax=Streptomyces sp. NBC_00388 TaxID=2975735 RepID=UPI002E1BD735
MLLKKRSCARAAFILAGAAALAATTLAPANADIPPAGTTFQIRTQFEGKAMCAEEPKPNDFGVLFYPFSHCDKRNPYQKWRLSKNGEGIQNIQSKICLHDHQYLAKHCVSVPRGKLAWKQDGKGHVFRQDGDAITRKFWYVIPHNYKGLIMSFQRTTNNTVPSNAGTFTFPTV